MKILFVLKRGVYGESYGDGAGGLLNSASFIVDMLREAGHIVRLVVVQDNNDIDRWVTIFAPDHVVIEALWVVPEKFDILKKLHPTVRWIVRVHSDLPFLAQEGVAMGWILGYLQRKVTVAFNSQRTAEDFEELFPGYPSVFLPNFYPVGPSMRTPLPGLHIGCFGAIRPLKNQLIQAVAAIEYANRKHLPNFSFHINATRTEQQGHNALRNIRALFVGTRHNLVEHEWLPHQSFLLLMSMMDIAMCVSMTETFCITAADAVRVGVPLVCSDQVPWAADSSIVPTTDTLAISQKLEALLEGSWWNVRTNRKNLEKYSQTARKLWLRFLKK